MKIRYLLLLTVLVIAMSSLFSLNAFAESTSDSSETPTITDLTNTTWDIPSGWTAEAGYGVFSVAGVAGSGSTNDFDFYELLIGYECININKRPTSKINNIAGRTAGVDQYDGYSNVATVQLRFTEGEDVTNTALISWLLANGTMRTQTLTVINSNDASETTSFTMPYGRDFEDFVDSEYNTNNVFTENDMDVFYKGKQLYRDIELGIPLVIDTSGPAIASGTFYYNGEASAEVPEPSEPDVPDPVPEPDEPEPEDPVTPSEPGEISIPIRDGHTLEYIYEFTIYDKPIDFLKQTVEGDEVVLEFVYSDLSTQYIRYKVPQHLEYEFTGLYVYFTDGSSTNIPKDYYRSVRGKELDHFRLGYVRAFSRCDLYFEGRGFSSIDFPMRDVAKIAIEKSYSDSYNNFDVYLQFNDGTTTFFEFSSVLPKVEGKTFAGFYIYDTENNVNVGDYIPCDGEFHDINQSGDFALNTCFLEYKSDFAVNFMNWSGTFTVRSFPFYTDLDYVIVTQDNKGITVEHYTPGADGELYVVDSEFFDDDTYVGIQKKPNRVNNFVEDDQFPLHIYISDKDVTYYLAPPDYEYLYDIHLGHEASKDNEELMDSISDALADLDLPDTGDFSLQIDAIFDNSGYYRYMDIFKNILEFDLFTSLLVVSFVMAMAGYVLFGKRG